MGVTWLVAIFALQLRTKFSKQARTESDTSLKLKKGDTKEISFK